MEGRMPVMAGNWKMNKAPSEAAVFAAALADRLNDVEGVELVVAPPFPSLPGVCRALDGTSLGVAGQDMHWENSGAYTGEVAPGMLTDLGVEWVIIGHSERRILFAETDEQVARKTEAALRGGLTPIICVGETEAQREAGGTEEILTDQIMGGLERLDSNAAQQIVVAYEPVWAIGTGRTATPEIAQEACAFTRQLLTRRFGAEGAREIRILYGGSVKPENTADLMRQSDIDGGLVGGASLDADSFTRIVQSVGRGS